ncbi:hypothetical protein FDECE_161 [Fusarium decemcellulare]|nr:hypothetical protein FDECE_161 [Fusarium decemcellulare]
MTRRPSHSLLSPNPRPRTTLLRNPQAGTATTSPLHAPKPCYRFGQHRRHGRPARSARPQRPCGSALYGCDHSQRHRRSGFVATKHPHHSSRKAMNEKFALMDLVQHHVKMSKRKGTISNGPLLYKHFLMLVFKEWTTGTRFNPNPSMKLRSFTDSNVKAGRQIRDARRCGAPVYLGITLNLEESTIGYLWRDQTPEFINPKYMRLDEGMTMASAPLAAINNYDLYKRDRVDTYNRNTIVGAARRRIVKWSVAGSAEGAAIPHIDPTDQIPSLKPLVLSYGLVEQPIRINQEVVDEVRKQGGLLEELVNQV